MEYSEEEVEACWKVAFKAGEALREAGLHPSSQGVVAAMLIAATSTPGKAQENLKRVLPVLEWVESMMRPKDQ